MRSDFPLNRSFLRINALKIYGLSKKIFSLGEIEERQLRRKLRKGCYWILLRFEGQQASSHWAFVLPENFLNNNSSSRCFITYCCSFINTFLIHYQTPSDLVSIV